MLPSHGYPSRRPPLDRPPVELEIKIQLADGFRPVIHRRILPESADWTSR